MREFIEFIAKELVDHPEDVHVGFIEGESTSIMELKVHNDDVGKVIGKRGKTANAMRTLLSAVATRKGRKVVLEIVED
ncbi:MAG: KH domain-containing protein [bacterium]